MLTLLTYHTYTKLPTVSRYFPVLLTFALCLMSKPMAITLPFLLLIMDYWPLNRFKKVPTRCLIMEKIPLLLPSILMAFLTLYTEKKSGALVTGGPVSIDIRLGNALICYVKYIWKMFVPGNLAVYYPYHVRWTSWQISVAGSILVAISLFVYGKGTRYLYLRTGWLWFLGTLVPMIGLIQVGPHAMADRYAYISLIGLFIIISWGMADFLKRFLASLNLCRFSGCGCHSRHDNDI